ncbi:MAG: amidohydrolase, partial [Acidimicrobiaceae bacterium]|nr:amidohydrolase [Acidimicrobiaceae bacterium]
MAYVTDRVIHDADAHVMETPEWIEGFASQRVLDYALDHFDIGDISATLTEIERSREMHADAEYQASAESEVMLRKNWRATGAFIPEDRVAALDYMGFASQLVYPTVYTTMLEELEYGDDPGLTYEVASAANRAHIAFCDIDPRLYAVAY